MPRDPFDQTGFDTFPGGASPKKEAPNVGGDGLGVRVARVRRRPRSWERKNQYGKGYSVKGVRPEHNAWLSSKARELGVPIAEVAQYCIQWALERKSDRLRFYPNPHPRATRMTLFPNGKGYRPVDTSQIPLPRKKGRKRTEDDNWRARTTNWTPFDEELKSKIRGICRDVVPQGELINYLLEAARKAADDGTLVFQVYQVYQYEEASGNEEGSLWT